ncbi:MAG: hypothetical protein ABW352_12380 [Polyangiales bacterium]
MSFFPLAVRTWACGIVLCVACGSDKAPTRDDGDPRGSRDAGTRKPDASARSDAGGSSARRDGGSNPTDPDDMPPDDGPAPFEVVKVDACGSDNAASLSEGDVDKLKAGGDAGNARWLYPYDGTVFPRGLTAPLLMWEGAAGEAVYVKIRSQYYEYDGCLPVSANGTLQLPQEVWESAGKQTLGPKTPFELELSTLSGGKVVGPIARKLIIAQATLKGSIYYNSYNSRRGGPLGGVGGGLPLPGGLGGGGSVLRIRPGKEAEFFVRQGACVGCHTVSANGERMIAKDLGGVNDAMVYAITPNTAPNPPPLRGTANGAFTGISPDGKVFINTAIMNLVGPNTTGALGTPPVNINSVLSETDTGTAVPNSGVPTTALMPTFAPDGTMLTFNDFAAGAGAGISLMDYDSGARTASNARSLWTGKNGFAGWPFLLPDNGAVVFTFGESRDFTGRGVGVNGFTFRGPRSELMIVDSMTGKATLLARAMGYDTPEDGDGDKTYLPFGAEELHQNYYPTVSPVAAGGYFWVFFDSVRHYGNKGTHRQLWGTAIAIQHGSGEFNSADGLYGKDPSYPAFYVPGQELETANHRAFTALDPCRADGETCETGIDCCSGFCTDGVCGPPMGCSEANQGCQTDQDCCEKTLKCINNFCGQIFL